MLYRHTCLPRVLLQAEINNYIIRSLNLPLPFPLKFTGFSRNAGQEQVVFLKLEENFTFLFFPEINFSYSQFFIN